jgi:hypothetical protein
MTTPDNTWLDKQQAAEVLGISTKTVEQLANEGVITKAKYRRDGRGPQLSVYEPAQIHQLAQERRETPGAFVRPESAPDLILGSAVPAVSAAPAASVAKMAEAFLHALKQHHGDALRTLQGANSQSANSQTSQSFRKLFLTITEAAEVSGLTEAYLRRACHEGRLVTIKDRGWKIQRTSLRDLVRPNATT